MCFGAETHYAPICNIHLETVRTAGQLGQKNRVSIGYIGGEGTKAIPTEVPKNLKLAVTLFASNHPTPIYPVRSKDPYCC